MFALLETCPYLRVQRDHRRLARISQQLALGQFLLQTSDMEPPGKKHQNRPLGLVLVHQLDDLVHEVQVALVGVHLLLILGQGSLGVLLRLRLRHLSTRARQPQPRRAQTLNWWCSAFSLQGNATCRGWSRTLPHARCEQEMARRVVNNGFFSLDSSAICRLSGGERRNEQASCGARTPTTRTSTSRVSMRAATSGR